MKVYQYPLTVLPEDIFDALIVHEIISKKSRFLYRCLGPHIVSGKMMFTMRPIDSELEIPQTQYKGKDCQIIIDKSGEQEIPISADFINRENSVVQNFLNIIFKTAFRQTHLK